MLKKILITFLILFSSLSYSSSYDGFFVDHTLDYPAFLGECSALLQIYSKGQENVETFEANYKKYMSLIFKLDSKQDKKRSVSYQNSFLNKLSDIQKPTEEEYWGLRNDLTVCAYWTGAKENQYQAKLDNH